MASMRTRHVILLLVSFVACGCATIGAVAWLDVRSRWHGFPVYDYSVPTYDAILGWTQAPRSNGNGRVAVVGDSWAWGLFVRREEAWPYLIDATNEAVSGYGYDQAVLRAEQLRGYERILIAICADDVQRCNLTTTYGASKPWFEECGRLHLPAGQVGLVDRTVFRSWQQHRYAMLSRQTDAVAAYLTRRAARIRGATIVLYRHRKESESLFCPIRDTAARVGLPVVDIGVLPRGAILMADPTHHPSPEGHRYIAARVREKL